MREWLVDIRKRSGLTQKQVATKSSITQGYYSMIEKGQRGQCIPLDTAQRIADVLNFSVEQFNKKQACG
jgi:transcriptional regulator with XRE-family HTH domain